MNKEIVDSIINATLAVCFFVLMLYILLRPTDYEDVITKYLGRERIVHRMLLLENHYHKGLKRKIMYE